MAPVNTAPNRPALTTPTTASITGRRRRRPAIARGLKGVALTETRLSHVDGERGELIIGGFPLADLAPHATAEEVLFLLWHDRLPAVAELAALRAELAARRALPAATMTLLCAAATGGVPPIDALRMAVATLSLDDPNPLAESRAANVERGIGLVARFPTVVAAYERLRHGLTPVAPRADLGHAANYLFMLTGVAPSEAITRALETYLNTVADHGMNASTFAARVIISTRSDLVSALVGAIGALKGPLHGGAPGPALDMVFAIQARAAASGRPIIAEAEAWVRETLASGGRIMGFGHRVYKVRDPRADVLNHAAAELFVHASDRTIYDVVREVEPVIVRVLSELKPGRRLDTNVEFYTALLLHAVGLDVDLFTPTFAIGRAGGWTAQVLEQIDEDCVLRPDAVYVGPRDRAWVPIGSRASVEHSAA